MIRNNVSTEITAPHDAWLSEGQQHYQTGGHSAEGGHSAKTLLPTAVYLPTMPSSHVPYMINAKNVAAIEVRRRHRSALLLFLSSVVAAVIAHAGCAPHVASSSPYAFYSDVGSSIHKQAGGGIHLLSELRS